MPATQPVLEVEGLQVHYGHAHALQGVSFSLATGVLAIVGRNGMGKTTLCNALMGLIPASGGTARSSGVDLLGLAPNEVVNLGIGYVPQGRRVWASLSVDEHLRLSARNANKDSNWTVEEQIAEGDKVLSRFVWTGTHHGEFLGIPATHRPIRVWGMVIDRFAGEKIVSTRILMDTFGLMVQLGVIPPPGPQAK